jgi:esterase/lipase superfamily enzyme
MGNRPLTYALLGIDDTSLLSKFQTIILTAPDIDAGVFREQIAPQLLTRTRHVVLYTSANDRALRLSEAIHGYPRAGDSGTNLVIINGIE